ncbi:MAG: hypothetical protein ACYC6W_03545 [Nitrosotalea sp.]
MKILHLGIIIVISALTIMFHPVMATNSFCDQHFDHGPTLGETIGKEQCENPIAQINYHGVNLTVTNMINKTTFQVGEKITVIPEITNAGNSNVTIGYCGQLFVTLAMDESDKIVSPQYSWACPLFDHGFTLPANSSATGEGYGQIITLHNPGNYTIRSIASFGGDSNPTVLWSTPIQIVILQEKFVQNETLPCHGYGCDQNSSALKQPSLEEQLGLTGPPRSSLQEQLDLYGIQNEKHQQDEQQAKNISNTIILASVGIPIAAGVSVGVLLFARKRK